MDAIRCLPTQLVLAGCLLLCHSSLTTAYGEQTAASDDGVQTWLESLIKLYHPVPADGGQQQEHYFTQDQLDYIKTLLDKMKLDSVSDDLKYEIVEHFFPKDSLIQEETTTPETADSEEQLQQQETNSTESIDSEEQVKQEETTTTEPTDSEEQVKQEETTTTEPTDSEEQVKQEETTTIEPIDSEEQVKQEETTTVEPTDSEEQVKQEETTTIEPTDSEEQVKQEETTTVEPTDSEEQVKQEETTTVGPIDSEEQVKQEETTTIEPTDSEEQAKETTTTESTDSEEQVKREETTTTTAPKDSEEQVKQEETTATTPKDSEEQVKPEETTTTEPTDSEEQVEQKPDSDDDDSDEEATTTTSTTTTTTSTTITTTPTTTTTTTTTPEAITSTEETTKKEVASTRTTLEPETSTTTATTTTTTSETTTETTAAQQTTTVQPSLELCTNCVVLHGIGYAPFPGYCDAYVQCRFYGDVPTAVTIRRCPSGHYWNQDKLTCDFEHNVKCTSVNNCPNHKAIAGDWGAYLIFNGATWTRVACPVGRTYNSVTCGCTDVHGGDDHNTQENCSDKKAIQGDKTGFLQFTGNGWVRMACPATVSYNEQTCRCTDRISPDTPNSACPHTKPIPGDKSGFLQFNGVSWIRRPCPATLVYSPDNCICTYDKTNNVDKDDSSSKDGHLCKPTLMLNFDSNDATDSSLNHFWVNNSGVTFNDGKAYFNGNSRLTIPGLSNMEFGSTVYILIKYRHSSATSKQTLVANGNCQVRQSLAVCSGKDSVDFYAETKEQISLGKVTVPTDVGAWQSAVYTLNNGSLIGNVGTHTVAQPVKGALDRRQSGLVIGGGGDCDNFHGIIDEIGVFRCKLRL